MARPREFDADDVLERAMQVFWAADSDQFARQFRDDLARDSDPISPTVPISNRPGTRAFQHVVFLTRVTVVGQPFLVCFERARRMLSPASSMRWALWTRRSRIASA